MANGLADTVVVIGGAAEGSSALQPFGSLLAAAGYQVEFCPQPRPDRAGDYATTALASVKATIDALGRPCHVIGYSLGSSVALNFALEHPSACRSLVLIAARARTTDYQAAVARSLADIAMRCGPETFAVLTAELSLSDTILADPDCAADWVDLLTCVPRDIEAYLWWVEGSLVPDLRSSLATVDMPVLVLSFENDRLVRPLASQELADSLIRAESINLLGLGHLGIVEDPRAVSASVLSFLADWADG